MAAAYDHVNAIARRIKRLGDTRTLDQVRADTAIDLLTGGTPQPPQPAAARKPATRKAGTPAPADTTTDDQRNSSEQERSDDDVPAAAPSPRADVADDDPVGAVDSDATEQAASGVETDGPCEAGDQQGGSASSGRRADDGQIPPTSPSPRARADVDLIVPITMLADLLDAVRRGVLVEVGGFGLVPADVAARLVKAAAARPSTWCMTLIDDTGRVIEHVRTAHDPTKAMRDFVNARDRHCRFPGCVVHAVRCDTDHTIAHDEGGATCPCNLAPLCRRHHRLKQAQGFDLTIDPETNNARWTTPHVGETTSPPWRHGHDDPAPF